LFSVYLQRSCEIFVVKKYILASSAKEAIKKDKTTPVDDCWMDEDFKKLFGCHISYKSDKQTTKSTLKWVHITISNAKRTLLGIYHMMKSEYLKAYLNEFCYRLNRRNFGENLFNIYIIASISASKTKNW
jgi:hypothetical protein